MTTKLVDSHSDVDRVADGRRLDVTVVSTAQHDPEHLSASIEQLE